MAKVQDYDIVLGEGERITFPDGSIGGYSGGYKNKIINGNFDVWQRGTSFSVGNMTYYHADRWRCGTATTGTITRESFTVGQTDVPNEPIYYLQIVKSGTGDYLVVEQRIEDVRTLAEKNMTISFYAKNSGSASGYIQPRQNFGSGGSSFVTVGTQYYDLTTSWQKFTFTFAVPSISGKTIGSGNYLSFLIAPYSGTAATTGTFSLAQVQVEEGSVDTGFEMRHKRQELALCKRYYQISYAYGTDLGTITYSNSVNWVAPAAGVTQFHGYWLYPVEMRIAPTVTFYNPYDGTTGTCRNVGAGTSPTITTGYAGAKGISAVTLGTSAAAGNTIFYHYTADAEL